MNPRRQKVYNEKGKVNVPFDLLLQSSAWGLLSISAVGVGAIFIIYPCVLAVRAGLGIGAPKKSRPDKAGADRLPPISIITVSSNAGDLLQRKVDNLAGLDYPSDLLEFIFYGDGLASAGFDIQRQLPGISVKSIMSETHHGKAAGLNRAAAAATGEILVFSDTDALLDTGAVRALVEPFQYPNIGGVCGLRTIGQERTALCSAQSRYLAFDNLIKTLESRTSSLTSNEGKLYAIRRSLFKPIDPAATDDLYTCLSVTRAGYRFVLAPRAVAYISSPSKNSRHEIARRRRVVVRSLHGIYQNRELFKPWKYGFYSFGLFVNKVMRRCLPLFLIGFLLACLLFSVQYIWARLLLLAQIVFYCTPLLYFLTARLPAVSGMGKLFRKSVSLPTYFILGIIGTLLGFFEFLGGKKVTKWVPRK